MLAAAVVLCIVTINAATNDGTQGAIIAGIAVTLACVVAAWLYLVEAHFAGRASREQVPTVPEEPTDHSVGPQGE